MTKELVEYLTKATNGISNREMARRLGMVHSTLRAQLAATDTPATTVVQICREYGLPLAPTFVAAGFISEEEARTFSGALALASFTDLELSKEMLRRVAMGSASGAITDPVNEKVVDDVLREVEDARARQGRSGYALAADEREDRTPGEFDGDDVRPSL